MREPSLGVVLLCAALLASPACDRTDATTAPQSATDVSGYIAAVSVDGVQATLVPGRPPADTGGPVLQIAGNETVITGGSNRLRLQATEPLTRLVVAVPDVDGYWDLALPTTARSSSIAAVLSIAQRIPVDRLEARITGAGDSGATGPGAPSTMTVLGVGTGDVQISLSWSAASDLDLHVVEPSGEEIYFRAPKSATSGTLDLDSNRACAIDGVNNENVTWPANMAPAGSYSVRVDLWDSCGAEIDGPIDFTVTVVVNGQPPATVDGTFDGFGDNGGLGSGVEVTTFSF